MRAINNPYISQRNILKQSNHYYLLANQHYFKQFDSPPTFEHVKAHSKIFWNESVDKLAKHSRANPKADPILLPPEIACQSNMIFLHKNNQMIQKYPANAIKHSYQADLRANNHNHIQRHYSVPINTLVSKELATSAPKLNHLDASSMFEQKFRTKTLTQTLSINSVLYKRHIISNPY